jgi:hypothetical protein
LGWVGFGWSVGWLGLFRWVRLGFRRREQFGLKSPVQPAPYRQSKGAADSLAQQGPLVEVLVDHGLVLDVLGPGGGVGWVGGRGLMGGQGGSADRPQRASRKIHGRPAPHLLANLRVERLSANASSAGDTMHIIVVLQLPPSESSRMRVSLESLG